jgi:ribosomal protein S18 acetylase RimI-like enzyme
LNVAVSIQSRSWYATRTREWDPDLQPLTEQDIDQLRLGWTTRFDRDDLRRFVSRYPGLTIWSPNSGEYVVAAPWRHRDDIVAVAELSGRELAVQLLQELASSAGAQGKRLVLISEHDELRAPTLYASARYDLIEHIMIYELPRLPNLDPNRFELRFSSMSVEDPDSLAELMELDHVSFPWLWWNSEEEFRNYGHSRGVMIYGARDAQGELVSYVGVTKFRSWGHLDRIAVLPERQGQGIGLESLEWAVYALGVSGARRIGLSTQARNERSRRLYERYGFRRSASQDYYLYGRWLEPNGQQPTGVR